MPRTAKLSAPPEWPADRVERWPIEKLIPSARNARMHTEAQVAQIAGSIREFGWTMPVLVDETGELIAGHGRVLGARQLGITTVPTMVASGWSLPKIRAYRIADNRLTELSSWDNEMLGLEFAELRSEAGDLLALTGFDAKAIDELIAGPKPPTDFAEFDEAIETEHECPKCGYRFSGGTSSKRRLTADDPEIEDAA